MIRIVDVVTEDDQIVAVWSDGSKTGGKHHGADAADRISELFKMCRKHYGTPDGRITAQNSNSARLAALHMYLDELGKARFLPQRANADSINLRDSAEKSPDL